MAEAGKKKLTKQRIKKAFRLYEYIKPYRYEYLSGMFFLLGSSVANLAFPKLVGDLVNSGTEGTLNNEINQIALILAVVLILQAVFSYFRIVLFVNVTEKTLAFLRQDTYNHLIRLPLSFFEKRRVGELNSRISSDITLLQETLTSTIAEFVRQIIIITGGIILLAFTSIKLTLFMLAILPGMMILGRWFGRYIRKLSRQVQDTIAASNTVVEETLQGIQSVKAFTNEMFEIARFRLKTNKIAKIAMKSGRYRGAFSSFIILGIFGAMVAVIWKGSTLLAAGEMKTGELFAFVIYSVFIGGTIGGLATVYTKIQKFIGATEDLFDIFNEQEEPLNISDNQNNSIHSGISGQFTIRNLNFEYPSRPGEKVLKNINLEVDQNQIIALVGSSGAGKSTLASLLLKLHHPTEGQILFDDKNSEDFPLTWLRSQISLVPQDIFLFGGTIRENIAYGKPGADNESIIQAAKKANAYDFIKDFPEKFDTVVGERGTQLSGGQRQRIAIARAVLKDPKILILDEATSSLDAESEKLVQDALEKLMRGRTSVIIAHRLSTIRKAHKIIVLQKGQIVEQGTHEQLIQVPDGIYKNLSKLQYAI